MNKTEITLNEALQLQCLNAPDTFFIHHKSASYTYGQVADLVDRFACYLQGVGVVAGDKICLMLPRTPEIIIAFLAATKIGAYAAPANYLLSAKDVAGFVKRLGPKVLISSNGLFSDELETELYWTKDFLCIDIDNCKDGWVPWHDVVAPCDENVDTQVKLEDVAYLNFTTGSSGFPKGALASHANLYWNTRSAIDVFAIDSTDVHLCMFASFAHPHELFVRALYTGGSLVLLEEVNPKTIIKTINKYSVTCMMGLAPMYEMMANRCGNLSIPSLRIAESGGMFTRRDVNETFKLKFGIPILSVWGSTETSGIGITNRPDDYKTDGSMGKVCPYYEVKLVDDDGVPVTQDEVGELLFKGPGVIAGYDDHATFLDSDGWYASGDMAKQSSDGFYYFVERKSGMIKVVGLKVYPLQVELFLLDHPDIVEIAVLGVPDRRKGFVPKAFVVIKDGKPFDLDDITSFCKGKLPAFMVPRHLEIMDSLPKIGSGKINKKAIVEMFGL